MANNLMTLAEAREYLKKTAEVEKSIWDLKRDIESGILAANKNKGSNRYWLDKQTLDQTYGASIEEIGGFTYYKLRLQGMAKEEIIERYLKPQCRKNGKNPNRLAGCFEAHIKMKTYAEKAEKALDLNQQAGLLEERLELSQKIAQKRSLGLYNEAKDLEDKLKKREVIHTIFRKYNNGAYVQLPVKKETQTEGLSASLHAFFFDPRFHEALKKENIGYATRFMPDGYFNIQFFGESDRIINVLREHFTNMQPEGFSQANLEARLFIDPDMLKAEKEKEKELETLTKKSFIPDWLTKEQVMKRLKISKQQLGGYVTSGKLERKEFGDDVYYIIKE